MLGDEAAQECPLWVSVRGAGVLLSSAPFRPVHLGNSGDRPLGANLGNSKDGAIHQSFSGSAFPCKLKTFWADKGQE